MSLSSHFLIYIISSFTLLKLIFTASIIMNNTIPFTNYHVFILFIVTSPLFQFSTNYLSRSVAIVVFNGQNRWYSTHISSFIFFEVVSFSLMPHCHFCGFSRLKIHCTHNNLLYMHFQLLWCSMQLRFHPFLLFLYIFTLSIQVHHVKPFTLELVITM